MKKILLCTGNKALIDDDLYEEFSKHHWHDDGRHVFRHENHRRIFMHREVMANELEEGLVVDHINLNGFDCQRKNLRVSTVQQNAFNRRPMKGYTSEYKGVSVRRLKTCVKFEARITHDGKEHYLGRFLSESKAAKTYNEKAKELFGTFAYLNEV